MLNYFMTKHIFLKPDQADNILTNGQTSNSDLKFGHLCDLFFKHFQ